MLCQIIYIKYDISYTIITVITNACQPITSWDQLCLNPVSWDAYQILCCTGLRGGRDAPAPQHEIPEIANEVTVVTDKTIEKSDSDSGKPFF